MTRNAALSLARLGRWYGTAMAGAPLPQIQMQPVCGAQLPTPGIARVGICPACCGHVQQLGLCPRTVQRERLRRYSPCEIRCTNTKGRGAHLTCTLPGGVHCHASKRLGWAPIYGRHRPQSAATLKPHSTTPSATAFSFFRSFL